MKIYYTTNFKEKLNQSYRSLELSKFKLSTEDLSLMSNLNDDYLISSSFLSTTSPSLIEYYKCEIIKTENGIQIYSYIPDTDKSLSENYYYKSMIFYFIDNTFGESEISPAFVVYQNTNPYFSKNNLFELSNLSWKCDLTFYNDNIIEYLENDYGSESSVINNYYQYNNDTSIISKDSVELSLLNLDDNEDKLETISINNYGIKIY